MSSKRWLPRLAFLLALVPQLAVARAAPAAKEDGWVPLFNGKDWSGLDGSLTDGADWKAIFKIEDGTIHVVAPFTYGFVSTTKSYGHYRCKVEYRWADGAVDGWNAGLLYHASGTMLPKNNWPGALEFQFRKGDAGSLWIFGGPWVSATQKNGVFAEPEEGGLLKQIGGGGYKTIKRRSNAEREGWNQAELVVRGDSSVYILNGVTTFKGSSIQGPDGQGGRAPLDHGAIRLQSEGAEVYYRNFLLQELDPITGAPKSGTTKARSPSGGLHPRGR